MKCVTNVVGGGDKAVKHNLADAINMDIEKFPQIKITQRFTKMLNIYKNVTEIRDDTACVQTQEN